MESCIHGLFESYKNQIILVVCDQFLVENPIVRKLLRLLREHNQVTIFSDVVPDPPLKKVIATVRVMLDSKPTVLIAVGGGSAIDTAKAARYFAKETKNLEVGEFIAVPSTSGSGSEVTSFAVVTDEEKNVKYPLIDDSLLPTKVALIPQLVSSCPPKVTAHSGMDVLTHALEALVAKGANGLTDSLAIRSVKLVFAELEHCYQNGDCLKSRRVLQEASCMAGIAFQNAGLGIVHAISHQIGGQFHLPHGLINSILLPEVIRLNASDPAVKHKYAWLAKDMGWIPMTGADSTGLIELIKHVKELTLKLDCETSLSACGITADKLAPVLGDMIQKTEEDATFAGNPIQPNREQLVQVLLSIL
ncbi:iron-containing alcohol dehydrogenase [Streptococcus massiliensis]|nr:iron-containing alcohol dehydrogenase [Streptococcus massiliensis]